LYTGSVPELGHMNREKINLIIKNMELLIESLKLEMAEEEEKQSNIVKLKDLISPSVDLIDTYEPDYYEE
jgi:hypothetical protein